LTPDQKIIAFSILGNYLNSDKLHTSGSIIDRAIQHNNWYTPETIKSAFEGISYMLEKEKLEHWIEKYSFSEETKTVGVIMAGNIPLVGFHDFLCILLAGHKIQAKLSSKDPVLLPFLAEQLINIQEDFKDHIDFTDRLSGFDAIIATGSDNSSNYFTQYFSKYSNIIRKNRVSCAILTGSEDKSELELIGNDILNYYGLGCRNVSKLFIPFEYKIADFIRSIDKYKRVMEHHKYANNYNYNKSIYLVNREKHYDNGFLLLKETEDLVSPISVVYFERYRSKEELSHKLSILKEKIQCVVSTEKLWSPTLFPGKTQLPEPWDYSDNKDTMEFLTSL
jgi:acyl-CoA reductase LuxC